MPPKKQKAPEEPGVVITLNDVKYAVRMSDMTAIDARDFRAAVGLTLVSVLFGQVPNDIDTIAGLVWLVRRRTEPGLAYSVVAGQINLTTAMDVDSTSGEDDGPEA